MLLILIESMMVAKKIVIKGVSLNSVLHYLNNDDNDMITWAHNCLFFFLPIWFNVCLIYD
jgi:hypothetical protein